MKNLSLIAVVLNWNETELTVRCVRSLVNSTGPPCDIMVVDNGSDEDPTAILQGAFPGIHVLRSSRNLGVAGGRNIGIRYALRHDYDYVLLLDNDASVDGQMIAELVAAAARTPDAGIWGPKILREDSPGVIWRAGCTSWRWTYLHSGCQIMKRMFKLFNIFPPLIFDTVRGEDQPDRGQFDTEEDIDFQIGCAQFIRTEVFRQVGLLDEEYSPYSTEDIDFCARVKKAGWRIRYIPKARCRHRVGGSFRDEYQRAYCTSRHLMILARKNLTPAYFWLLFVPDFLFLTIPFMFMESIVKRTPERRKALMDAVIWNINDVRKRGVLIR